MNKPKDLVLRCMRNQDDFAGIARTLQASELADHVTMTISAEEIAVMLQPSSHFDPDNDLVIVQVGGEMIGVGRVYRSEEVSRRTYKLSGYIIPEWRRKGIGKELLDWLEGRARSSAMEQASGLPSLLRINATQYQTGLHALARQSGYISKESWVLMVRPDLENIHDPPLPDGLEIRPVQPEHFASIWRAVEEAYVPEGGPSPTGVIPEDFRNDPNFQPELWQVAWDTRTGKVAGSVMTYVFHADNERMGLRRGYTEGISTVPEWQKKGVATALIASSLKAQREAGMTESALVCNGEKHGNYRLFESCGFREIKRDTVYEKPLTVASKSL